MDVPRCKDCPEHGCASGRCLAAYAPDQQAMSNTLDQVRGHTILSVVTMDVPLPQPCEGGYLCQCEVCVRGKVAVIKQVRQPWQPLRRAA